MHSLTSDIEEGPLDMDAEDTRNTRRDGATHCRDGARDDVEICADQRRQEASGAKVAVGGADGADRIHGRCIVEQHPATTVHLQVDESRQQQSAGEVMGLSCAATHIIGRQHIQDARVLDQHTVAAHEPVSAQHPPVDQCAGLHIVSVTLRKCGGASGLSPRASASAFAMR